MNIVLKQIPMPSFQFPGSGAPVIPTEEYDRRLKSLVQAAGTDWVVVYADREHNANLTYLVNFDPRFEEALLVLGSNGRRVLITGNEGMGYTPILRVALDLELCQTCSLNSQPRSTAARLKDTLVKIGLRAGQSVSVIGWKYLEPEETDDVTAPAFIPAFYADALRAILGPTGKLVDRTGLLMHPETGLRAYGNSADQIAAFEWAARCTSAGIFNIVRNTRPGMSEMQVVGLMGYAGQPFTMHPIVVSGKGATNGLQSPTGKIVEYGDAISAGIGYWGSLVCRAGMVLGAPDRAFMEKVAAPYFKVIVSWFEAVRIGATGGEIFDTVSQAFAGSGMRSSLNPGHLTSVEEWLSSPIRPGSTEKIRSGMVLQSDIIPTPVPEGWLMNCEDTAAIADASLRAELQSKYPGLWTRIQTRRELMTSALGIRLPEEVLPLSDGTAYLPPFWLASDWVCTVESR
jgi:Xaa-Pro aminopeptidase